VTAVTGVTIAPGLAGSVDGEPMGGPVTVAVPHAFFAAARSSAVKSTRSGRSIKKGGGGGEKERATIPDNSTAESGRPKGFLSEFQAFDLTVRPKCWTPVSTEKKCLRLDGSCVAGPGGCSLAKFACSETRGHGVARSRRRTTQGRDVGYRLTTAIGWFRKQAQKGLRIFSSITLPYLAIRLIRLQRCKTISVRRLEESRLTLQHSDKDAPVF